MKNISTTKKESRQATKKAEINISPLEALNRISRTLYGQLDLKTVSDATLDIILQTMNIEAGILWYFNEQKEVLELLSHRGFSAELSRKWDNLSVYKPEEILAGKVFIYGEPIIVDEFKNQEKTWLPWLADTNFQFYFGLPLKIKSKVVGVISGFSGNKHTYISEDMDMLGSLGNMVAMAIVNARLFQTIETRKKWWERAFDAMSDGIAVIDPDLRVLQANWALARMLGTVPGELSGRYYYSLLHGSDNPIEDCPVTRCIAEKRSCFLQRQEPYLNNDWLYLWADPILGQNNEVTTVLYIIRNVTEAVSVAQAKTEFLSAVSHDLRTPLASLKTSVELLQNVKEAELNQNSRNKLLANMQRSIDRLEKLTTELFDISALDRATMKLNLEQVAPADAIAAATGVMYSLFQDKKQIFSLDIEPKLPCILADRHRLQQILVNLLSNTNKFSQEGSYIRLKVYRQGNNVVFEVADNGLGIHEKDIENIFKPFFRVSDESTKNIPGSGLGLNLVKRLVELHGGLVWFKSKIGEGTVFYFTMPVGKQK